MVFLAMAKDLSYVYGICIGLSLLHGGPPPACLAPSFYHVLVGCAQDYPAALADIAHASPYIKLLKVSCNDFFVILANVN